MLTDQQRIERKTGIGGSDVAAIAGRSSYKTALDIYLSKIGLKDDDVDNVHTRVGQKLEDILVEIFRDNMGLDVDITTQTFRHPIHNFMLANVDGLVPVDDAAIECKTALSWTKEKWGESGTDNIPDEYLLQVAHYCEVLGLRQIYLPVCFLTMEEKELIDSLDTVKDRHVLKKIALRDFKIYVYLRSEQLQNRLIQIEKEFWEQSVLNQIPPIPQNYEDIMKLYPLSNKKEIIATPEDISELEKLNEIRKNIKLLEEQQLILKNNLCSRLRDASKLISPDGTRLLTWESVKTNRFDASTFKEMHPSLYSEFCKESQTRVFRTL